MDLRVALAGRPAPVAWAALSSAVLAALGGCQRAVAARPPGPIGSAVIAVAADLGASPSEIAEAWGGVDQIAARIARRHAGHPPADWIADVNAVVFDELGFEREIQNQDVRTFRLPSVIADRRGSCLGLGALYLVLAERLGFGLDGIMVPGHFFVRTRGAQPANVELLRRGEIMPDDWYRQKYGPWPAAPSAYFRPLSASEITAAHWYNFARQRRAAGDLTGAAAAYRRAVADLPQFERSSSP